MQHHHVPRLLSHPLGLIGHRSLCGTTVGMKSLLNRLCKGCGLLIIHGDSIVLDGMTGGIRGTCPKSAPNIASIIAISKFHFCEDSP